MVEASDHSSQRVLVVVDDDEQRADLLAAVAGAGLDTLVARSAREALAELRRSALAAMIIDADIPPNGGFELAQSVRRHAGGGTLALLLLTDVRWSPPQKAAAIQQMGLLDILAKPVSAEQVAELLAGELATRQPEPPEPLADRASHEERAQVERATHAARKGPIKLRGNLQSTPFPGLLHTLYRQRATGALFLLKDNVKKIIYFRDGHPVYVKSNLLSECLGKVLVRERMISESECQESLRHMRRTRRQQGTVLVEMGVISPQNLVVGLELQLETKLFDLFAWTRGEYLFKSESKLPSEAISLYLSNASLIAEGVRRHWSLERTRQATAHLLEAYLAPAADPQLRFQEIQLDELEQALRDDIDGTRTLRQHLAQTPLAETRALTIIFVLLSAGIIEARDRPLSQEVEPETSDETSIRERLAAEIKSLKHRDPFGVLGVSATAADPEIEQAYSALAREYHPDRFRQCSAETRQMAHDLFGIVYDAYEQICSVSRRRAYNEQLDALEDIDDSVSEAQGLMADRVLRRAEQLIAEARWSEARAELEVAVERVEGASDLRVLLGWVIYNSAPDDLKTSRAAIRQLRRAIEIHPRDHQAYLYLGRVYGRMGKRILAEKQFEKALQCKPDCAEALQELRIQQELRPPRRGARSSINLDDG